MALSSVDERVEDERAKGEERCVLSSAAVVSVDGGGRIGADEDTMKRDLELEDLQDCCCNGD